MKYLSLIISIFLISCQNDKSLEFYKQVSTLEKIQGKAEYSNSPFLSAGNRAYIVGHQNGSFPDLGWLVKGEMGGVWLPPIKLLDGYHAEIKKSNQQFCLTKADHFLNYPVGNEQTYQFKKAGIKISQFHFVPEHEEGIVIAYQVENTLAETNNFQFSMNVAIDLRPVWLADSLNIKDGQDTGEWKSTKSVFVAKDSNNSWYTALGGKDFKISKTKSFCRQQHIGKGFNISLKRSINLKADEKQTFYFVISGSSESEKQAVKTHRFLSRNVETLLQQKITAYEKVEQTTTLKTRNQEFDQMYRWSKYNAKWLMQEVPQIGTAMTAGSPDNPWWSGTHNGYAVQGLLAAGMHQQALETIDLIIKLSKNVNGNSGRIIHEASTNGVIYNSGNLTSTPKFISMLWKAFAWTGDESLLNYYNLVHNAVDWVESQDKNRNGYPEGAGMINTPGLDGEMIDVVAYQYEMYLAAANFAKVKGDKVLTDEYLVKAEKLKMKINADWWVVNSNSFADFRATKSKALRLTNAAIIRADSLHNTWAVTELQGIVEVIETHQTQDPLPYVVHHNWIVNTPMEVGAADRANAIAALKTAEKYSSRFGVFVTGIDSNQKQEKARKRASYSDVGAAMTLPTGVQAVAEAKYGNPDRALDYLNMLENSFSYTLPGSMYEVSPGYGMISQGWNIYAVAVPVVEEFFGIQPKAWKNEILIKPNLPTAWTDVSLENIKVGNNQIDISAKRIDNMLEFRISQLYNWKIIFEFKGAKSIVYDGNKIKGEKVELYDRIHNLQVTF